jgi:hypothetical protein
MKTIAPIPTSICKANAVLNLNYDVVLFNAKNSMLMSVTMSSIKVYDIRGRLLVEKKDVNTKETRINIGTTSQVFLVQVTANEGLKATKKVVN